MGGQREEEKCVQGRHYWKDLAVSFRKWVSVLQVARGEWPLSNTEAWRGLQREGQVLPQAKLSHLYFAYAGLIPGDHLGTHGNFQLILEKSQVHLNYKSQLGKMAGLLACWVPDWKEHRCLALLPCAPQAACEISQNGVLSLHILHFAISKPYDDMFVPLWLYRIVIIVTAYIHWQAGWLWKDTQSEQHSKKSGIFRQKGQTFTP